MPTHPDDPPRFPRHSERWTDWGWPEQADNGWSSRYQRPEPEAKPTEEAPRA